MMKTVSFAAIISMIASASFAGSLNTTYEAEPVAPVAVVPAGSSGGIGVPVVVGGLLAAAAVAAIVSNNNDNDSDTDTDNNDSDD